MLAEQALLREQAEEAKFYMTEAEAKANEYEELATKLWGHLDRAGIDVEANVERPKKRERPRFVSGLTITQGAANSTRRWRRSSASSCKQTKTCRSS